MEGRRKKSLRNITIGIFNKFLLMAFAFTTRTIFIRLLGVEYNGVNGLYGNILSVLSISELGISYVLNFFLYQALKDNDKAKVRTLVLFFKKIYRVIAFSVFGLGMLVVPFLPVIINNTLPQDRLVIYYLLYLLNSIVSYFVVYKTTVISADQNNYIVNICETVSTMVMYISQMVYLLVSKDFLGYLTIQVICTIGKNVVLNCIANRKYPYLNDKNIKPVPIDKKGMFSDIKATFLYKIAGVIVNNTDNILISIIVGTVYVGYYANYYMIINYIATFVAIFIGGITASLGNFNADGDKDDSYRMFRIYSLIFNIMGTITSCCLICCIQDFISVWIGESNVQSFSWVIVIVFNNYLSEVMSPVWMFRETMGLFKQVQYVLLVTALINLILSVVLGEIFGVPGILMATALSRLVFQYWYEPKMLFNIKFNRPFSNFLANQVKHSTTCIVAIVLSILVCNNIEGGLIDIIIKAVISALIAILCISIVNFKSDEWGYLYKSFIRPVLVNVKFLKGNR